MNGTWAHLSLIRGDDDDEERVHAQAAFKRVHPGADFDHVGNVYIGFVPYIIQGEERSITIKADSWRVVLRSLEEYFADGGPDAG